MPTRLQACEESKQHPNLAGRTNSEKRRTDLVLCQLLIFKSDLLEALGLITNIESTDSHLDDPPF